MPADGFDASAGGQGTSGANVARTTAGDVAGKSVGIAVGVPAPSSTS